MWLERLVEATRDRVEDGYYDQRPDPGTPLDPVGSLRAAVERAYPAILAEIKPARPEGPLREVDPAEQALAYADGGACAISVLTDPDHFGGALSNLEAARAAHRPLLMKDFLVDERQLDAAHAWGASAVLVIARLHDGEHTDLDLSAAVEGARARGLEAFVEVADLEELGAALQVGADLIGINARDLDTLEMDPHRTGRLVAEREIEVPVIHLSGIEGPQDIERALASGAQGVLVGTAAMQAEDPRAFLRSLRGGSA